MIQSFDIFDTCLTRRVAEPAEVFDLMAAREGLGSSFRYLRQEAEREATRRHGDATLAEIHRILAKWIGNDEKGFRRLMEAELEEEARQLIPIPEILAEVKSCRQQGGRVVYLSDMYLPSSFLRSRLREYGFHEDDDLLLVSCELRRSKATGELYHEATKQLDQKTWEHFGNDLQADVKAANRAGVLGIHRPWGNLTRYEETLLSWKRNHGGSAGDWAGAARCARMKSGASSHNDKIIARVSAGIAGPLVFIFASWLVERAAALGLTNLYFLARDGQVFTEAFDRVAAARGLHVRAKYLHASRISLRFPREFPLNEEDAAGVFQGNEKVPVTVVAARLGVPEARVREWLPADCIHGEMIPAPLVSRVRSILASPEIVSELERVASVRSELLLEYLRQEGFLDEEQPTVVDLGWNGSLQAGLQKALQYAGSRSRVQGLYFGLASFPYPDSQADALIDDTRIPGTSFAHWTSSVTELLCTADHGSTLGFEKLEDGTIKAVLDDPDGDNPLVPGWLTLHRIVIREFVGETLSRGCVQIVPAAYRRLLVSLLEQFWLSPAKEEATVWGECRFASHGLASTSVALAPRPKTLKDILWAADIGTFGVGNSLWQSGTAAKLPCHFSFIANIVRRAKRRFARAR